MSYQLETTARELGDALKATKKSIETHNIIPILGNVLMNEEGLTTTNLDRSLTVPLIGEGSCTVGHTELLSAIKGLPLPTPIKLYIGEYEQLYVEADGVTIKLDTLPPEDFPKAPLNFSEREVIKIPVDILKPTLDLTLTTISTEEERYYLNGIWMHSYRDHITFAAADGHRLSRVITDLEYPSSWPKEGVIIPREFCKILPSFLKGVDYVDLQVHEAGLKMNINGMVLTTKLVNETFPDITRVIPKVKTSATIPVPKVAKIITRFNSLKSERNTGTQFDFPENKIRLKRPEAEAGLSLNTNGVKHTIAFDTGYLTDMIKSMDKICDEMVFSTAAEGDPARIQPANQPYWGEVDYVLMPMRY